MPWEHTEHNLLARCVDDARAEVDIHSAKVSRFYKALEQCPSLQTSEPDPDDLQLCLDALSVAGKPPLDGTRRAESALVALTRGTRSVPIQRAAALANSRPIRPQPITPNFTVLIATPH